MSREGFNGFRVWVHIYCRHKGRCLGLDYARASIGESERVSSMPQEDLPPSNSGILGIKQDPDIIRIVSYSHYYCCIYLRRGDPFLRKNNSLISTLSPKSL